LLRKAKHQLSAPHRNGRRTGVLVVNNASFSIGVARRLFAAALLEQAKETRVIDFLIFVNVFAQSIEEPKIDLSVLPCTDDSSVAGSANEIVEALMPLPREIQKAAQRCRPRPHRPPVVRVRFQAGRQPTRS
jgi:hypothetical protein